jgi:hypothetical protein
MKIAVQKLESYANDILPMNTFADKEIAAMNRSNKATNIVLGFAAYGIIVMLVVGCAQGFLLKQRLLDRKMQ